MVGELDYSSCEKESCAPNMMASGQSSIFFQVSVDFPFLNVHHS